MASKPESWLHLPIHLHRNSGYLQICLGKFRKKGGRRERKATRAVAACGQQVLVELPSPLAEGQAGQWGMPVKLAAWRGRWCQAPGFPHRLCCEYNSLPSTRLNGGQESVGMGCANQKCR